jgi:hypothetical protein
MIIHITTSIPIHKLYRLKQPPSEQTTQSTVYAKVTGEKRVTRNWSTPP